MTSAQRPKPSPKSKAIGKVSMRPEGVALEQNRSSMTRITRMQAQGIDLAISLWLLVDRKALAVPKWPVKMLMRMSMAPRTHDGRDSA